MLDKLVRHNAIAAALLMVGCYMPMSLAAEQTTPAVTPTMAEPTSTTVIVLEPEWSFWGDAIPTAAISGGYGAFDSAADDTGQTGVLRIALGSLWYLNPTTLLGGELGAQTGNRMELDSDILAPFGVDPDDRLPVYLTVKPVVDLLATLRYYIHSPLFIEAKAGAAYIATMIDNADISSESQWRPEIQLGLGWDLTDHGRIMLGYQRIFGSSDLDLSDVDVLQGSAALDHVPTWQAVLLTFEFDL